MKTLEHEFRDYVTTMYPGGVDDLNLAHVQTAFVAGLTVAEGHFRLLAIIGKPMGPKLLGEFRTQLFELQEKSKAETVIRPNGLN